jgi:hypothetical protein
MLQFCELEECVGKTIKAWGNLGSGTVIAITFTDNTYTAIRATTRPYDDDASAVPASGELDPHYDYGDWEGLGLATTEEIEEIFQKKVKEQAEQTKHQELRKLKELKAKYES